MEIITWSQLRIHAKPVSLQSFFLALLYTNDNCEPILHIDLYQLCRINFASHDLQKFFLSRILEQQFLPIVVAPPVL